MSNLGAIEKLLYGFFCQGCLRQAEVLAHNGSFCKRCWKFLGGLYDTRSDFVAKDGSRIPRDFSGLARYLKYVYQETPEKVETLMTLDFEIEEKK